MSTGKTLVITTTALGGAVGIGYLIVRSRHKPVTADTEHDMDETSADDLRMAQASNDVQVTPLSVFNDTIYPLPRLPDGLKPRITSHHKVRNPSRAHHNGVDWFYRTSPDDPPWKLGDGGGTTNKKWIVPPGTPAIAVASGLVQVAGDTPTGKRVWIKHGRWRSGYFHLDKLFVKKNQIVASGQQLGLVGDNPRDHDARHLHFEISAVDRYQPVDPVPFLTQASPLPLDRTIGPIRMITGIPARRVNV